MQHATQIPNLDAMPPGHVLATREAAAVLNRSQQTLRKWACLECGPLRPVRINGRLAWRVSDLRRVIGGAE